MEFQCDKCNFYWYNPTLPKKCPKCGCKHITEK